MSELENMLRESDEKAGVAETKLKSAFESLEKSEKEVGLHFESLTGIQIMHEHVCNYHSPWALTPDLPIAYKIEVDAHHMTTSHLLHIPYIHNSAYNRC